MGRIAQRVYSVQTLSFTKKREELSAALRLKAKGTDSKAPGCREVGGSGLLDSR